MIVANMHCRVVKEPYKPLGAGNRADGQHRQFIVLEIMDDEFPEEDEWDYGDIVEVTLVSPANRKKRSSRSKYRE